MENNDFPSWLEPPLDLDVTGESAKLKKSQNVTNTVQRQITEHEKIQQKPLQMTVTHSQSKPSSIIRTQQQSFFSQQQQKRNASNISSCGTTIPKHKTNKKNEFRSNQKTKIDDITNKRSNRHGKKPLKIFAEKITIRKPQSMMESNDDNCEINDIVIVRRNFIPEIAEIKRTDLPSHVPTPDTIDDNALEKANENPWFSSIFTILDGGNQKNNNKVSTNERPIKYFPSFDTPPSTPVASKKKLKKGTKWGSDYWHAKKSNNKSSPKSVALSSSLSFKDDIRNGNIDSIARSENFRKGTKCPSIVGTHQEEFLKKVINGKNEQNQDHNSKEDKKSLIIIPSKGAQKESEGFMKEEHEVPEGDIDEEPYTEHSRISYPTTNKKNDEDSIVTRTITKANVNDKKASQIDEFSIIGATTSSDATQLQRKWMYEKASNLQMNLSCSEINFYPEDHQ